MNFENLTLRSFFVTSTPPAVIIVNMSEDRHRVPVIYGGRIDRTWQDEEWLDAPWDEWTSIKPAFEITELT